MLKYFGVYDTDTNRKYVNVFGNTVENCVTKYENYVNKNHGYIVNLYPMNSEKNKKLFGALSEIVPTI
jgi:hypothetical protein|nr:MAG TPA: hypothetical protein [Caudoviricetes sp.]